VSPRATPSLIRGHYLCLIKLFHPDRLPEATAADIACSRRLNAAYHVLAAPEQRACYDRTHPGRKRRIRSSDPRDFYGHHWVPLEMGEAPARTGFAANPWLWSGSIGVLGLLLGGIVILLWQAEGPRSLRANGPLAMTAAPPRPYYLQGTGTTRTTQSQAAVQRPVAADAPASSHAPTNNADIDRRAALIGRRIANELQIAFRRGDRAQLAALFVEASWTALRHSDDLSSKEADRPAQSRRKLWLTFQDMAWRSSPDGRINGSGRIIVAREGPNGATREVHGSVDLELVPTDADYRVRRFRIQED